ncbi:hypothetical protein [Tranquillimonas alkanivorans]|uniref:Uncharacterized protein n=1 Tax=Tranquillimonas alkanivorans TaxID=441119 RepID=A0A1I5TTD5_9RHOB|nr:hypothetical protein [Tranquillimonas alkanivorans]SFP86330.1 hypothetical protein SAMN04488047_11519 [Tranquillimonas alkanivorans]
MHTASISRADRWAAGGLYFVDPPLMSAESREWVSSATPNASSSLFVIPRGVIEDDIDADAEVCLLQGMQFRSSRSQLLLPSHEFRDAQSVLAADAMVRDQVGHIGDPFDGRSSIGLRPNALLLLNEPALEDLTHGARPAGEETIAIAMARPTSFHARLRAMGDLLDHMATAERWLCAQAGAHGLFARRYMIGGIHWGGHDEDTRELLRAAGVTDPASEMGELVTAGAA